MRHTYRMRYETKLGLTEDRVCIIPDQVAENQKDYEGRTFIAIIPAGVRGTGRDFEKKMRVKLLGDDYDLYGSGTGDILVRPISYCHAVARDV